MSDLPFGFGPADRENRPDKPSGGDGPAGGAPGFGFGAGMGLPDDLLGKMPLLSELQKLFSWSGGPVNWDLARQLATSQLAGSHSVVSPGDRSAAEQALRLADLWLDDVTSLPSGITTVEAWTRVEWVEKTLRVWSTLCDPLASRVVDSLAQGLPEEIRAQAGPMAPMMGQLGGMMFGSQVGQALAGLAGEVVSATDVGLPLGPSGTAALIPANVAEFSAGLDRPADEVRLYLALREAAHHRLFGHVPWLRQRLIDTVEAYGRGIVIDTSGLEQAMTQIDPANPESIQEALSGGMFQPQETPEQQAALRRLETLLALVEGWVDAVVDAAAGARLTGADALRETLRRRRATGGPAEQTFATLVGLELRPRRLRDASALWATAADRLGQEGRDALWAHPDLLPASDDLDDPQAFVERQTGPGSDPLAELAATEEAERRAAQNDTTQNDTTQNDTTQNDTTQDSAAGDGDSQDRAPGSGSENSGTDDAGPDDPGPDGPQHR